MLHYSTVEQETTNLLRQLMEIPELNDFSLVGGTCLSLRYGHRKSIDLDLFNPVPFDNSVLIETLGKNFPSFVTNSSVNAIGVFGYINEIKVDFVKQHNFKLLNPIEIVEGIRMFSDEDIMAMKVFAVLQRGQKKDFWDIAELLKHYTVKDFVSAYERKYPKHQMLISINYALTYFDEADESEDPVSLAGQTWDGVKKTIRKAVREYLK
jgi:predicted nucleotidyltransferase component of viral defense system